MQFSIGESCDLGEEHARQGKNNVQMEKHREVTAQRRGREGQREEDKIREAMQGQTGPGFFYEGERKQLQSLVREIT